MILANNATNDYSLPLDPNNGNPFVAGVIGSNRDRGIHPGVDIAVIDGTSVLSFLGGIVVGTGFQDSGFGNYVVIKHEIDGLINYSIYAHLQQINVAVGDLVLTGTEIGFSNNTGSSRGPHLHFEVRRRSGFNEQTERFQGDYWPTDEDAIDALYVSPAQYMPEFNDAYGDAIETVDYAYVRATNWNSFLHDLRKIPVN